MIAAVLASGVPPERAAAAAAWLHADAARRGPRRGLLAGDIIDLIPAALGAL
jgi:NAD(P)H-hydrate repair Nnr-like enzyme with NAD(P)H-hydrate dehydratase domain